MIAWHRLGSVLVTAPGWVVTVGKFTIGAIDINVIPKSKHSAGDGIQQFCSRFIVIVVTSGYVPRANKDNRTHISRSVESRISLG